ncbi:hypothetical protein [Pusillimonas noertemannii]|uniref:Terminase small subunit n=1 Tax=Pusillimonas noertemannii TaxID=305977 RepID=A0A2U1CME5_9BURK|nr:hypothetical protein [Pusillimonas noertemannii]NYT68787.1 hypothetical protein [Pusillimonas noertemannii]PVY62190.1 hypothetical protein C7440_1683 [Pusillimonas noertemannii]TFL10823.1 hypothetical protein CSC72_09940 [Pusillimonas noertemannii]
MAAKPKLSPEEWGQIRDTWEADPRDGYTWLVRELDLPVSAPAVRKTAVRDSWAKKGAAQAPSAPPAPEKAPAKGKVSPKVSKVSKVSQSKPETVRETIETIPQNSPAPEQEPTQPNPVGRPTLYQDAYAEQVYKLCLLGATDEELADFFGIAVSTLNNWKLAHPDFVEALKAGKLKADSEVANSLYKRALGYSHPEDDIRTVSVGDGMSEIVITPTTKHYPPETTAAIFWLKNRQPKQWKDKVEIKEEINVNIFPPKEELDAIYAKTLKEAEDVEFRVVEGRMERLGIKFDGDVEDGD